MSTAGTTGVIDVSPFLYTPKTELVRAFKRSLLFNLLKTYRAGGNTVIDPYSLSLTITTLVKVHHLDINHFPCRNLVLAGEHLLFRHAGPLGALELPD